MFIVANIEDHSLGLVHSCNDIDQAVTLGATMAIQRLPNIKPNEVIKALEINYEYHTKLPNGTRYSVCIGEVT